MLRLCLVLVQAVLLGLIFGRAAAEADAPGSVTVKIDAGEAQAAVAILGKLHRNEPVGSADWNALFTSAGYERLKKREAQFKRPFTDEDFRAFLSTPKMVAQYQTLSDTLTRWDSSDIAALAQRSFAYLPAGAALHATVYPLIKPRSNSFVYELDTDPAIMLYLDPAVTKGQFGNTVSHELYHVGDAQNCPPPPVAAQEAKLPPPKSDVLTWLSAFGEGSAVLAAAGGPGIHPHAEDPPSDRAVWDKAMSGYDTDFQSLEQFFSDIVTGKLKGEAIATKGYTFFGDVQGPWYTVGYKMDVTIEHAFGRSKLIEAICDKREYFATYNAAVKRDDLSLPLWPDQLASLFK